MKAHHEGRAKAIAIAAIAILLGAASLASAAGVVTPIADIHANLLTYTGQVVTVRGQVYIPSNYRGNVFSGYIQDSSGRGINLFGSAADTPLLQNVTNIVEVTGQVATFFTTVEIINITSVVLVSNGNPPLQPQHLTTGQANDAAWEGTYIEVTGEITSSALSGPGINYRVDDGTGSIEVRVVLSLGLPQQPIGTTVTARGAGSRFQAIYQILVGTPTAFFPDIPVAVEAKTWCEIKALFRP